MKIYAKQIDPEFQESLIFEEGLFPENMVVCGNRDFKERKTAVFTLVENYPGLLSRRLERDFLPRGRLEPGGVGRF